MKCPHCQKEIPNYAQTREYCKEESSANQLQTTNNSSPGTLELPGQASLLATLPDKELQWAYYASIFLRLFGLLLYVIAIIPVFVVGMIGIIDGCMSLWQDFIWSCLIPFSCSIVLYAIGYVMRNIRTKTTRIILQGLALLSLASYSYACYELFKEEPLAYYIPMIVLLTFCGWLWRLNRKMKLLFGETAPSHEQIAYAWSCRKRHLDLDAASLPAPRHPGRLDKTFVVASWLWLPLVVLAIVETTFPSLWKKNAMEELAIQATANTQPDHDAQVQPKKTLEEIRGEEITWDDLSAIVYRETGIFGPTEEFFLSLEDPAVVHAFGSGGGFGCIGMVYLSDEDMHSLINSIPEDRIHYLGPDEKYATLESRYSFEDNKDLAYDFKGKVLVNFEDFKKQGYKEQITYWKKVLSQKELEATCHAFEHSNVNCWILEYVTPDICDGTSWYLNLRFRDGQSICVYGSNAWPGPQGNCLAATDSYWNSEIPPLIKNLYGLFLEQ